MPDETIAARWQVRCPDCASHRDLLIEVRALACLTLDGTIAAQSDHEWDEDSTMICNACGADGSAGEFYDTQKAWAKAHPTDPFGDPPPLLQ